MEPSDKVSARIIASVRGVDIVVSLDTIREIYELPEVESSYLPRLAGTESNLDSVVCSLVGTQLTWGAFMSIPLIFLSLDHRVLVSIYHHCIRPKALHSVITTSDPYFIYAVGAGRPIDLSLIFFEEIVQCLLRFREGQGQSLRLVLGSLIYRLAEAQGVPLLLDEKVVRCWEGAYNLSSLRKSVANAIVIRELIDIRTTHSFTTSTARLQGRGIMC